MGNSLLPAHRTAAKGGPCTQEVLGSYNRFPTSFYWVMGLFTETGLVGIEYPWCCHVCSRFWRLYWHALNDNSAWIEIRSNTLFSSQKATSRRCPAWAKDLNYQLKRYGKNDKNHAGALQKRHTYMMMIVEQAPPLCHERCQGGAWRVSSPYRAWAHRELKAARPF